MKKTKMKMSKKLSLNKSQITPLAAEQANNVAGGAGTGQLITFNALCDLNSSKNFSWQGSRCVCV